MKYFQKVQQHNPGCRGGGGEIGNSLELEGRGAHSIFRGLDWRSGIFLGERCV